MNKHLIANIKTNLKFYRRNKLLILIAIFFLFIWGMAFIPSLIFISAGQKFKIIQSFLQQSGWFINIFIAALGMLTIFHHMNSRSYKMVITKPCSPEIWLLSNFISAMLVAASLYLLVFLSSLIMFLVWHIPLQWGLLYIILDGFFRSVISFSILTFLTVVVHPFIAVLVISLINEGTFYWLIVLVSAGLKTATKLSAKIILYIGKYFLYVIYMLLPSFTPFSDETHKIYSGLKIIPSDLKYLGLTFLYTTLISLLFYFLADYSLKSKRHI